MLDDWFSSLTIITSVRDIIVLQFGQLLTDLHWCHQNYKKKSLIQHYLCRFFRSFKLRSHDVDVHSFNLLQLQITTSGSVQLCQTPRWLNLLQTPLHNRNYLIWMSGKDKGRMGSRWPRRFCLLHGPGKMMKRRWKRREQKNCLGIWSNLLKRA